MLTSGTTFVTESAFQILKGEMKDVVNKHAKTNRDGLSDRPEKNYFSQDDV